MSRELRRAPHPVTRVYRRKVMRTAAGYRSRAYCVLCHRRAGTTFSEKLASTKDGSPSWLHHVDPAYDEPRPDWLEE